MKHSPNISYLANKTNSINQTLRSTTAILTGLLHHQEPIIDTTTEEETFPRKHILKLDDLSLISSNRSYTRTQNIDLPWFKQESANPGRTTYTSRGSTPRSKRGRVTLLQVSPMRKTEANH